MHPRIWYYEVICLNWESVAKPAVLFIFFIRALWGNINQSIETLEPLIIMIIQLSNLLFGIRILIEVGFLDEHEAGVCIVKESLITLKSPICI